MNSPWPSNPLGEIAPANGCDMPCDDAVVWNLSLEDIEGGTGNVLRRVASRVSDLGSSKCAFDSRHVLYSKLRPYLNKVVLPDAPGVGTSELIPLKPDPVVLDREFLAFYLRSKAFLDFAANNTRGANLPRIGMAELWKHRVPSPPVALQRRIVGRIKEMLARVDEAVALRAEIAKEVTAVFPSVLASRFDDLATTSPVVSVDSVISESRYGTSQKCGRDETATPVLRIPNVADGKVNFDDLKYRPFDASEIRLLKLLDGDVLVVRTNGSKELVGRCAVFQKQDRDFAFASYLIRLRPDRKEVVPQYLAYFLESTRGRDAIASIRKTSAGQYNVNSENLRAIEFPCPTLSVQERAVEQMDEQRAVTRMIREQVTQRRLEEQPLRDAILRKAFAGEL